MSENDTAVLYGYFRSTAYRVRIALGLKGLAADHRFVHLRKGEQSEPPYLEINPAGLVPYWTQGELHLGQSLAIIEYLDEIHPQPPLLPQGAAARAIAREITQAVCCDIHPIGNLRVLNRLIELGVGEAERAQWSRHWIETGFAAIEAAFEIAGTVCIWPAADARRYLHRAAGVQCATVRGRSRAVSEDMRSGCRRREAGSIRRRRTRPAARCRVTQRAFFTSPHRGEVGIRAQLEFRVRGRRG